MPTPEEKKAKRFRKRSLGLLEDILGELVRIRRALVDG